MDNAASGATQYLKSLTDITALVGAFSSADPIAANAGQPYIFHVGLAGELLVVIKGTGASAIACSSAGGFQAGEPGTTAQYERLSVEFWVDVARDSYGNITETSGLTLSRAQQLYYTADSHLHRIPPGDVAVWGDLVTVGCWRLTAPQFYAIPDGGGLLRGQAYYAVTISGHTGAPV